MGGGKRRREDEREEGKGERGEEGGDTVDR